MPARILTSSVELMEHEPRNVDTFFRNGFGEGEFTPMLSVIVDVKMRFIKMIIFCCLLLYSGLLFQLTSKIVRSISVIAPQPFTQSLALHTTFLKPFESSAYYMRSQCFKSVVFRDLY